MIFVRSDEATKRKECEGTCFVLLCAWQKVSDWKREVLCELFSTITHPRTHVHTHTHTHEAASWGKPKFEAESYAWQEQQVLYCCFVCSEKQDQRYSRQFAKARGFKTPVVLTVMFLFSKSFSIGEFYYKRNTCRPFWPFPAANMLCWVNTWGTSSCPFPLQSVRLWLSFDSRVILHQHIGVFGAPMSPGLFVREWKHCPQG